MQKRREKIVKYAQSVKTKAVSHLINVYLLEKQFFFKEIKVTLKAFPFEKNI